MPSSVTRRSAYSEVISLGGFMLVRVPLSLDREGRSKCTVAPGTVQRQAQPPVTGARLIAGCLSRAGSDLRGDRRCNRGWSPSGPGGSVRPLVRIGGLCRQERGDAPGPCARRGEHLVVEG